MGPWSITHEEKNETAANSGKLNQFTTKNDGNGAQWSSQARIKEKKSSGQFTFLYHSYRREIASEGGNAAR